MTKEELIEKIRSIFGEIFEYNLDITLDDIISIYEQVKNEMI